MLLRICGVLLFVLVVVGGGTATYGSAATIALPTIAGAERITDASQVGANKFKPAQCASLTLTKLVVVTGASGSGTNANSLIIGNGSRSQTLTGGNGSDCIVAGGASTSINNSLNGGGGSGADVLIGGKNATNTYNGGAGSDVCYYRSHDTVPTAGNCDTRILLP
jgi:Ca2+-binding RTX toxin-like protein